MVADVEFLRFRHNCYFLWYMRLKLKWRKECSIFVYIVGNFLLIFEPPLALYMIINAQINLIA